MKNKNLINSFKYAFVGIATALKNERNMKIHFLAVLVVTIFALKYNISSLEWIACLICFAMVISSEMINTAMENISNLVEPNKNLKIKAIKDISAGAVLINAIISVIIAAIIFIPKIF